MLSFLLSSDLDSLGDKSEYIHNDVRPDWMDMSYSGLVAWRAERVITDNNVAVAFNLL